MIRTGKPKGEKEVKTSRSAVAKGPPDRRKETVERGGIKDTGSILFKERGCG
jgi:hypothetical protein